MLKFLCCGMTVIYTIAFFILVAWIHIADAKRRM